MAESTESTDSVDVDPAQSTGAGFPVFPAILTVMIVFPFTLALSFITKSTVPAQATLEAATQPVVPVPNQIDPRPQDCQIPADVMTRADGHLKDGHFDKALLLYRSWGNGNSLRLPPDLALRIAMCQEGLGQWDDALAGYRSVASTTQGRPAVGANLGQARTWMRLNDFAHAEPMLRHLILQSQDTNAIPEDITTEVVALFSLAIAEQSQLLVDNRAIDGLKPAANLIDVVVEDPRRWERDSLQLVEAKGYAVADATSPLNDEPLAHELASLESTMSLSAVAKSCQGLLQEIAQQGGFRLNWQEASQQRAFGRTLRINTASLPLPVLLTLICREMDSTWTVDLHERMIVITDSLPGHERPYSSCAMAATTVASVLAHYPQHRLHAALTFASAQLTECQHEFAHAATVYSSLVGRNSSPIAVRAAYNGALAFHRLGDVANAAKQLEYVVHGAPANELHTPALILYGRLLMDQGDYYEAAFQLKRAAESRNPAEVQARAAVFLAMALILDQRPHEAAEALFAHRLQFQDRTVRSAAALMTTLARCQTVTGASRDRETPFLYRSISAVEQDSDWLGPSGQLLLGKAMLEADLEDQMAVLFAAAIERRVPDRVADEMTLLLADYWRSHGQVDDAQETWTRLYERNPDRFALAGFRLAELALDKSDPRTCLTICSDLKRADNIPMLDLFKLAGRACEMAGEQKLAARCYAGQWPFP